MTSVLCSGCRKPNSEFNRHCTHCGELLPLSSASGSGMAHPLQTGPLMQRSIGHYKVLREIGAGGMGRVFEALDTRLGRHIALKVLPPALAEDPMRLKRFQSEARTVAALNHPNIVTLYSVEEAEGLHFLTMELVDGEPLDELVTKGPMTTLQILDIAIPLLEGLEAAHHKGILHRDLKPANLMRNRAGLLKILDFGLAELWMEPLPEEYQGTQSEIDPHFQSMTVRLITPPNPSRIENMLRETEGGLFQRRLSGTLPYVAPEQIQGHRLDPRADLFAVGVILFELSTGRRPFQGQSVPDLIHAILNSSPQPLTELRPDLPADLVLIIERCLAKSLTDRYSTAKEVIEDLRSIQVRILPSTKTKATKVGIGIALMVATLALLRTLETPAWLQESEPSLTVERTVPLVTGPSYDLQSRIAPNSQHIAFLSDRNGRFELWLQSLSDRTSHLLVALPEADIHTIAWSPDSQEIAFTYLQSNQVRLGIFKLKNETWNVIPTKAPLTTEHLIIGWVKPNIYFKNLHEIIRMDINKNIFDKIFESKKDELILHSDINFSGSQALIALAKDKQIDLWVTSFQDGILQRLTSDRAIESFPRWMDPQSDMALFIRTEGGATTLNAVSVPIGKVRTVLQNLQGLTLEDVAGDGSFLTVTRDKLDSHLFSLENEEASLRQRTADALNDLLPSVSANGQVIFLRTQDGPSRTEVSTGRTRAFSTNWDASEWDRNELDISSTLLARISPDGKKAALLTLPQVQPGEPQPPPSRAHVQIVDLPEAQTRRLIDKRFRLGAENNVPTYFQAENIAWSFDSKSLYYAYRDERDLAVIARHQLETNETEIISTSQAPAQALRISPSPTGESIAYAFLYRDQKTKIETSLDIRLWSSSQKQERSLSRFQLENNSRPPLILGWADSNLLLFVDSIDRQQDIARLNIRTLDLAGNWQTLETIKNAHHPASSWFDPLKKQIYISRQEKNIINLFKFSLTDSSWKQITNNLFPGRTYSGLGTTSKGGLILTQQDFGSDIDCIYLSKGQKKPRSS